MSYSLIIAGRYANSRAFYDIHRQPLLARHPGKVLLFVDATMTEQFPATPNCTVVGIQYMAIDKMLEVARRYQAEAGISSISTLDEKSVDIVATLRVALGVPGLSPEESRRFRDKVVMKEYLAAQGLRIPDFCPFTDVDATRGLLQRYGKIVVKPRDGMGSKDVSFICSEAELDKLRPRIVKPEEFQAEEFIDGTLYHTNSVVSNGEVLFTAAAPYLPGMANIDFTAGTPFVSLMETQGDLYARLCEFSRQAISALGLKNGVTHLEAFCTASGEIVFCEVGVRPGGGGIVHMIEAQYGVNLSLAALLAEEGLAAQALAEQHELDTRIGLIGVRNTGMGKIALSINDDTFADSWVRYVEIEVTEGQFRAPSSHCTDFLGLLIVEAANEAQFQDRIGDIHRRFDSAVRLMPL
ncbi:ATP-grasp domain-containing protein [Tahibacter amnicola]|uniref:ATP-grasp domain-containing protein n=1 Tax=Tahibacter amnicola TaxID=2976241 RepID=A0ABY6B859_9GAMM|nr:hypothetical protein [Tahibacter amnicola]UXI66199.1 hypothetical protein N4264_15730 [Tahibacter amnicola]